MRAQQLVVRLAVMLARKRLMLALSLTSRTFSNTFARFAARHRSIRGIEGVRTNVSSVILWRGSSVCVFVCVKSLSPYFPCLLFSSLVTTKPNRYESQTITGRARENVIVSLHISCVFSSVFCEPSIIAIEFARTFDALPRANGVFSGKS
jgi:hypothetical protein